MCRPVPAFSTMTGSSVSEDSYEDREVLRTDADDA
jgi:hypothetical protein